MLFSCKKDLNSDAKSSCNCPNEKPVVKRQLVRISVGNDTVILENEDGRFFLGNDIILSNEQVKLISTNHNNSQRTAIAEFVKYWPSGRIYYTINPTVSNPQRILNAINHWENNTSLRFIQRTNESNYIEFVNSNSNCQSNIGMIGGRQTIELSTGCNTGAVIHEIGHAVGFFHEMARADRDNTIVIHWENIIPGMEHNFLTYNQKNLPGFEIGNFDVNSIMMYGAFAFTSNGNPTITGVQPTGLPNNMIPVQNIQLSIGDIETADYIYGPPFAKIEYINKLYEHTYGESEDEYSLDDIYLKLYADVNCTIPYTGSKSVLVYFKYYETTLGSYWQNVNSVMIPSGTNSVLLGNDLVTIRYHADYGTPTIYERVGYEGVGGNYR